MKAGKIVVMGVAVSLLFCGLAPSAYAKHGAAKTHFKFNKHSGLFGGNYLAPKKQKKPTGYYVSTMTGKNGLREPEGEEVRTPPGTAIFFIVAKIFATANEVRGTVLDARNWKRGPYMQVEPVVEIPAAQFPSFLVSRGQRITAFTLFVALASCGMTSCTKTQVALSTAGIAAIIAGTTVGVTLAVKHHNHTLQGCVSSDADALKLRTSDGRVYTLRGDTAGIKAGDSASVHGSKAKKAKGGEPVFVVQRLNKDYGPCRQQVASAGAH